MSSSPTTANHVSFPKKDQAVVLNSVNETKLTDYVVAVGSLVQPKNVLFASRIANNRICIYLKDKLLVDELVTKYSSLTINNQEVGIRRLITPAQRIIISNVCPTIPHDSILSVIKTLGYKPVSPVSFLRAGIQNEEYSHVLSFRRQIFVTPDESIDLPSSLVIKHDGTNYRIFLTYDDQTCFKCHLIGHIASQCISQPQEITDPNILNKPTLTKVQDEVTTRNANAPTNETTETEHVPEKARPSLEVSANKRSSSSAESPEAEHSIPSSENSSFDRAFKKVRTSDSTESLTGTFELLEPARSLCEVADPPFVLEFSELVKFMEDVVGESDVLTIAFNYTSDIVGLLDELHQIYTSLSHTSIRNRCLKVQRKLKKAYARHQTCSMESNNDPDTY
ncbi:hypothetical protein Zmor_018297 [Zophobas morio]|uniref:CCHC-type domain-containing protein n=1 Tax=Zophobas morio TaxID=2755281 RepID=A0AA38IDZ1_9CUCU|nr:hypothetical protein Zmor_018297 [Zophobas morio]